METPVPVNSSTSRLAHPVKVESIWEVRPDTLRALLMRTREEQLWKHSPRVVSAVVMRPSISCNAVCRTGPPAFLVYEGGKVIERHVVGK